MDYRKSTQIAKNSMPLSIPRFAINLSIYTSLYIHVHVHPSLYLQSAAASPKIPTTPAIPNPSKPVSLGAKACEMELDGPPDVVLPDPAPAVVLAPLVMLIPPLAVGLPAIPPLNALLITLPVVAARLLPELVLVALTIAPNSPAAVATPP